MISRIFKLTTLVAATSVMVGGLTVAAMADADDHKLTMDNGQTLVTDLKPAASSPLDHVYSGWRFRASETQSLQLDDFENPAFPAVDAGEALWSTADGSEGKSCSSCHNDAATKHEGRSRCNAKMGCGY